jgi:chromosome segregation ATPase
VVNERHPLYRRIDRESVEAFVTRAANLSELVDKKADMESALARTEAALTKAAAAIADAGNVEQENRGVSARMQKLNEERERQKELARKNETVSPEAKSQIERLLEGATVRVNKSRETVQKCRTQLKERNDALIDAESALAKCNVQTKIKAAQEQIETISTERVRDQAAKEKTARLVSLSSALQALGHPGECPACAVFGIHTDWTKLPDDIFIPTLKNFGGKEVAERTRLEKRIEDHLRKLHELNDLSRGAKEEQAQLRGQCSEIREEMAALTEKMKAAERELAKANTDLHELGAKKVAADKKAQGKLAIIEFELGTLEQRRKALQPMLEALRKAKATKDRAEDEAKAAKKNLAQVTAELDDGLSNARRVFNQAAKALLRQLGFRDFKEVSIDKNFQIQIVRGEGEGYTEAPNELSTSESTTLTILLALAAKGTYFPEFPFFVIDTITTCYNVNAHKRFIEFLGRELKCHVIVTLLMPTEQELKVFNEFPASVSLSRR